MKLFVEIMNHCGLKTTYGSEKKTMFESFSIESAVKKVHDRARKLRSSADYEHMFCPIRQMIIKHSLYTQLHNRRCINIYSDIANL